MSALLQKLVQPLLQQGDQVLADELLLHRVDEHAPRAGVQVVDESLVLLLQSAVHVRQVLGYVPLVQQPLALGRVQTVRRLQKSARTHMHKYM